MAFLDRKIKFQYENGELMIGHMSVSQAIAIVGHLPCYVYSRSMISERINYFRSLMPSALKLHYAIKANPSPSVVHFIAKQVDGLDVASHKELRLALETQVPPKNISMAGPGKSDNDLRAAVAAGVTLNVESANEVDRIYQIAELLSVREVNLALRINPNFKVKGIGMAMGGRATQFGIDEDCLAAAIKRVHNPADIKSLHIFSGSQNLNSGALGVIFQKTFETAERMIKKHGLTISRINIGGGLGIPYFEKDQDLDLGFVASVLHQELEKWHKKYPGCMVEMELGRFLVGEAGAYLCQVVDKKKSREKTFLVTNGGLHHHLAATGNFGQVIRKNYPIAIATKMGEEPTDTYDIVGPLCTPIDTFATNIALPTAEIGDVIAIFSRELTAIRPAHTIF
ncbi:MAG: hypothetical protein JKY34_16480 [Kordiimonadaceae bacterium]|nr:hypothetical protein [Kordiimonadaceae bacterium]